MPTPKKGARLGGSPAHQKLILSNLAAQLIEHRAITTTEAKAKTLRPYVEKLITKAKRGDQHARRTVMKKIPNKGIVAILFEELVPAMDSERAGGYTRLIRVGNRKGDNARHGEGREEGRREGCREDRCEGRRRRGREGR